MINIAEEKELSKLAKICHINLKNSNECLDYLINKRELSKDIIKKFKLGYFPRNPSSLKKFISTSFLQKLNILDYSENSTFSEFFYLVFPIYSEYKEVVAIGGRTLLNDEERVVLNLPKYKNSSYEKSSYLYGLDKARGHILKEQNVYIVEGYFDCISMYSNGLKNTVAICGTAFSKKHMLKLARYTDKLTFILDRDDSGKKSMERILKKYSNYGIKLRFKLLPDGYKDADQFFRKHNSKEDLLNQLVDIIPALEFI